VVGLVIVSHSPALAGGVVELAREMGGPEVAIEAAGGLDDGAIGTDAALVLAAVERVRSPDGVLILMDLGSALMSAEMAAEMAEPDGGPVLLSAAPLVEGAVAAAARARGGASLEEVAAEARGALAMKTSQLGEEEQAAGEEAADAAGDWASELRLVVGNRLGLHARPAARFVEAVSGLDAQVDVRNATRDRGPADARSLTGVATLAVRQGDEIAVRARGEQAHAALAALRALAEDNFGDALEEGDAVAAGAPAGATAGSPARATAGSPAGATPGSTAASTAASTPDSTAASTAASIPDSMAASTARAEAAPARGTRLRGVPASPGIAIGPARRLVPSAPVVDDAPAGDPAEERERLSAALAAVRADLEEARATVAARAGAEEAEIFTAQALLLDDVALTAPALRGIDDGAGAGRAWHAAAQGAAAAFRGLDDPYLRERAVDVEDVGRRVLARLAGTPAGATTQGAGIVIAAELTPGEAAGLHADDAWAVATARGGATSHAAILARALGIPAVVGLGDALLAIPEGTPLILDGEAGTLDVDPGAEAVAESEARRVAEAARRNALLARAAEPGALRDGRRIEVFANVGSAEEASAAVEHGAEGVGLLRTEFLFLDRATPPDEDEQVEALTAIARALDGRPMVVRTLDAGADKPLPFLRLQAEDNPFLGVRGIRLSLARPELLRTQLRATLRVAAEHPVKVMFPMVATLDELLAARALLDEVRGQAQLELGVMVEVPALALQANEIAPHVDFFSVGTNDLAQYAMAAERGNAALAGLLDDSLPPVLALIAHVTAAAEAHGRWVGVCGELAGDPSAAVLLAGLGVSELSMAASRIPAVKAALRETDSEAAAAAARAALPPGPAR
jgi:phosphoenolpyruvate-protein phosphotransferase/dihydroxyacetone kinase phosphotransfer subunit